MSRPGLLVERFMSNSNLVFIRSRPFLLAFLYPSSCGGVTQKKEQSLRRTQKLSPWPTVGTNPAMDNLFVDALVQAGTCQKHCITTPSRSLFPESFFTYHKARRRSPQSPVQYARMFHDLPASSERQGPRPTISREEYKGLVDYYREPYTTQAFLLEKNAPMLALPAPPIEEDAVEKTVNVGLRLQPRTEDEEWAIAELMRVLEEEDVEQRRVFEAYSALPFPGVAYLDDVARHLLLRRMSRVELKSQKSMMRFLSVIDDMKSADIGIIEAEWNSAISFVGRCFVRVTAVEVEAALRMWKEMEEDAGVSSGHVTFNILFDIATKAGKYVLAEMILKEMASRNLHLNRFAHVGLIFYHGIKQDGQGVRKAYRELVEAGHVIDNVVLDCVIASFLRAGELPAAGQLYERRKRLFAEKSNTRVPHMIENWRRMRELGNVLDKAKLVWKENPQKLQQIQAEQYLGPSLRTYSIFIEHHVSVSGELRCVTNMLDEMQSFGIPMHGRVFVKIFKGFAYHGGVKYTSWTRARLESVWSALRSALDSEIDGVSIEKWMVVWIMRAFTKCCGKERALELWAEMKLRWEPEPGELNAVHHLLSGTFNPVDPNSGEKTSYDVESKANSI